METTTKTGQDIFDYKKKLEELGLTTDAVYGLFSQIKQYQDTHNSLVQEYAEVARRAQRSIDTMNRGLAVTTMDLVNSNSDRITQLVFTLRTIADALNAMETALDAEINWPDFITYK
jgi:hypothetical protein